MDSKGSFRIILLDFKRKTQGHTNFSGFPKEEDVWRREREK